MKQRNIDRFNQEASGWDEKPHLKDLGAKTAASIQENIGLDKTFVCMDFGCGTGIISALLAPQVKQIVGVDTSDKMIEGYILKARTMHRDNMQGVCMDITDKDAEDQLLRLSLPVEYDLIICHMVLHHVEDMKAVLSCLQKFLKANGSLAITDLKKTRQSASFHSQHAHDTVSAVGGFNLAELSEVLIECGYSEIQLEAGALSLVKEVEDEHEQGKTIPREFPIFLAIIKK